MAEKIYDFRKRMLQVHAKNRRVNKPVNPGQIEINEEWKIVVPKGNDFLYGRALDLADYFSTSMNMEINVVSEASDKVIVYEIDPTLSKDGAYRVDVSESKVRLIGKDERASAQAGYLLEDLINVEEAPYLYVGATDRAPLMRCRMVHSGYAEDEYPDGHLNAIAHSGINAILLYVCGVNKTDLHEFDFNDLIKRAANHGIDVYAYSHMQSRMHPDDEGAPEYYDSLYGELFRKCPGIKGVILVGESTEFPSKDPRTSGMFWQENRGPDGKPLIKKPSPGWFPCSDYPQWLDMVKNTIRKVRPDADVVFWTYNWIKSAKNEAADLLKNKFPTDITINTRFDKEQDGIRQGLYVDAADYTISFPNEGTRFTEEAEILAARNIPIYSITNAGGLTWDVGVVPYLPAPYLWVERYKAMRRCHDKYGLCGSMDSHHYGFYPSIISEIAKEYLCSEDPDGDRIIEKLIIRDWGAENKDTVEKAYRTFSEAIYDHITSGTEQYGPLRIGPAYPLVLFADENIKLWSYPGARHKENMICNPNYRNKSPLQDCEIERFNAEIRAFKSCADRIIDASKTLGELANALPESKRDNARRIAGVAEFVGRTYLTTYHVKRWFAEKTELVKKRGDLQAHLDELKNIGTDEIANVKETIALVDFDSRLGYEPSMDYVADRAHLEWKIELLRKILNEELPSLEKEMK